MNIKKILKRLLPKHTHDDCDSCQEFHPITNMYYVIDKGVKLHVCGECAEHIEVSA